MQKLVFEYSDFNDDNAYQNQHVIQEILSLDNLISKEIYSILISNSVTKPNLINYFEQILENATLD